MPLRDYACRSCGKDFEALVYGDERPECPGCGSHDLERRLSGFSVGSAARPLPAGSGPCGSCGDPRGPGACRTD